MSSFVETQPFFNKKKLNNFIKKIIKAKNTNEKLISFLYIIIQYSARKEGKKSIDEMHKIFSREILKYFDMKDE